MKYIKYIALLLIAFWALNKSQAQVHYQKMDPTTRSVELLITKTQIESNNQQIKYLNEQKNKLSLFNKNESIIKSRNQSIISSKEDENFRLNHKLFLINKAKETPLTVK